VFVDGRGSMRWKLFGILPIISASGPDITRSAAGRINSESIWLPSVLCDQKIRWTESDASHARARFTAHSEAAEIDCLIDENGKLKAVSMARWGNPEGTASHCVKFGGFAEQEGRSAATLFPLSYASASISEVTNLNLTENSSASPSMTSPTANR